MDYLVKSIVREEDGRVDLEASKSTYIAHLLASNEKKLDQFIDQLSKEKVECLEKIDQSFQDYMTNRYTWDCLSREAITKIFGKFPAVAAFEKNSLVSLAKNEMLNSKMVKNHQRQMAETMLTAFVDDNSNHFESLLVNCNGKVSLRDR